MQTQTGTLVGFFRPFELFFFILLCCFLRVSLSFLCVIINISSMTYNSLFHQDNLFLYMCLMALSMEMYSLFLFLSPSMGFLFRMQQITHPFVWFKTIHLSSLCGFCAADECGNLFCIQILLFCLLEFLQLFCNLYVLKIFLS